MSNKKLAARIYDAIWPQQKSQKRIYAAAKRVRTNSDWTTFSTTQNYELRTSLVILRARARAAARDQGHFKKFLSLTRSNVIGPRGLILQSRARSADGTLNVELNKRVEDAWWLWSHKETCTLSTRLNWLDVQRLAVTQLARDGEFLIQKMPVANGFGFALKVWNVDYLDETFTTLSPSSGNRIIMSIEVDDNDRPVAYWLTRPFADVEFTRAESRQRIRVPASEMIHGFLCFDDEAQVRGVTWFSAALLEGQNFTGYKTGVITSARATAMSMGFLIRDGDETEFTGPEDETGEPAQVELDISPVTFNELPAGYDIKQFDPKQPTQNHSAFTKTILTDLAAALDVPYFYLSGDMEAVNFSSSRVGLDDAREIWKSLQDFIATNLCREVFHAWLPNAVMSRQLTMTASEYKEVLNPSWRGRGWKYIDPVKDVNADVLSLENHLTTFTDVHAERGEDLVDFLERRQSELALGRKYGIELIAVSNVRVTETADAPKDDATGDTGKAKTTTTGSDTPKRYINGHDPDELVN